MDQLPTHYHAIKVALLVELHGEKKTVPLLLPWSLIEIMIKKNCTERGYDTHCQAILSDQ